MLTAIAKKVLSWSSLSLFNNFVDIFTQNVKTDLSATDIAWFATQAVGVDFSTGVSTGTLPGDGDARYNGVSWCYQLDREGCLEIFNELLNPYTTEILNQVEGSKEIEFSLVSPTVCGEAAL